MENTSSLIRRRKARTNCCAAASRTDVCSQLAHRPHITYAPRGARWTWRGIRFLAAGGAVSVDREWREPGETWWEEEAITEADVLRSIAGGPADVVVSHDSPAGVDAMGPETCGDKDADPASWRNREQLRRIVDAVPPRLLVHGHYHHPKESDLELDGRTSGSSASAVTATQAHSGSSTSTSFPAHPPPTSAARPRSAPSQPGRT